MSQGSESEKALSPDVEAVAEVAAVIESAIAVDLPAAKVASKAVSKTVGKGKTASKAASKTAAETWNYEEMVQRVEAIVARIESGDLELAAVFDQFAEAVDYLQQCEEFLSQRQQQVDLLIETLSDDAEF